MASYLLDIVTGAILALMAARHLFSLRHAHLKPHHSDGHVHLFLGEGEAAHWAEMTLSGAIFLFGLWVIFTAGLLLVSRVLHVMA